MFIYPIYNHNWSVRHGPAAASLLRLWIRITPGTWMSVCCDCCVLSCIGLCNELITYPEESYRLWCVVVCDLETLWMRRPWPIGDCCDKNKQTHNDVPFEVQYCVVDITSSKYILRWISRFYGVKRNSIESSNVVASWRVCNPSIPRTLICFG
jgi:hypothetical protein